MTGSGLIADVLIPPPYLSIELLMNWWSASLIFLRKLASGIYIFLRLSMLSSSSKGSNSSPSTMGLKGPPYASCSLSTKFSYSVYSNLVRASSSWPSSKLIELLKHYLRASASATFSCYSLNFCCISAIYLSLTLTARSTFSLTILSIPSMSFLTFSQYPLKWSLSCLHVRYI